MASDVGVRLEAERERIRAAAIRANRDPASVRLLAVSKFHPAERIRQAYAAGQRDFGENYVQELTTKAKALADLAGLRWHLIGHLQTNKARQVAAVASSVQTVDSVRLARELGRRRDPELGPLGVLVEVNVSGESQKAGCPPAELEEILIAIESEPALRLEGLLTVPPLTDDPEDARPHFTELARLRALHGGAARLPELSMGMSADLEVAIECGATWVRIGTAIFGQRPSERPAGEPTEAP